MLGPQLPPGRSSEGLGRLSVSCVADVDGWLIAEGGQVKLRPGPVAVVAVLRSGQTARVKRLSPVGPLQGCDHHENHEY